MPAINVTNMHLGLQGLFYRNSTKLSQQIINRFGNQPYRSTWDSVIVPFGLEKKKMVMLTLTAIIKKHENIENKQKHLE